MHTLVTKITVFITNSYTLILILLVKFIVYRGDNHISGTPFRLYIATLQMTIIPPKNSAQISSTKLKSLSTTQSHHFSKTCTRATNNKIELETVTIILYTNHTTKTKNIDSNESNTTFTTGNHTTKIGKDTFFNSLTLQPRPPKI